MWISLVSIGLASVILWLLKLYIYGGWSKMPGYGYKSLDKMFPPRTKEEEEEIMRRRESIKKRRAEQEREAAAKEKENGPRKTFIEEAEEFIAKRKAEAEQRKETRKNWNSTRTIFEKQETKTFDWMRNGNDADSD